MPFVALRIALRALARPRLRTSLTIIGIMVGIGAVICTWSSATIPRGTRHAASVDPIESLRAE